MNSVNKILTEIDNISTKHNIDMKINIFEGIELWCEGEDKKRDNKWSLFEKKAGIYCFISRKTDKILYIGESSVNVGNRLNSWLLNPKSDKEIEINETLRKNDKILIVTIEEQNYMARAVEAFLLDKFDTKFNVRI
ncbi:MAG: GIY-YIG nuclease family protein [Bacteroidales bacterium]|nr:GIY-YIG nuclease family protein [Bacteroidales bacterium]